MTSLSNKIVILCLKPVYAFNILIMLVSWGRFYCDSAYERSEISFFRAIGADEPNFFTSQDSEFTVMFLPTPNTAIPMPLVTSTLTGQSKECIHHNFKIVINCIN